MIARTLRGLLVFAIAALLLSGCGGSNDDSGSAGTVATPVEAPPLPAEIRVTLNGYKGAENAGLLMADKRGYFDDAGLDVWLGRPLAPRNAVYYVAARFDVLGVAPLPQVAVAQENGLPVVAVGSVIPKPTAAMIWLEGAKIRTVADLAGKTIGVPGLPFQEDLLQVVLERAGLTLDDVEVQPVGYRLVPALARGQVDAIFGGSGNIEGVALESQGLAPVIKPVQSFGVPDYDELVVITRSDTAAANPEAIRAFMSAVRRGTAAAVRDPGAAAKVIEKSPERDPNSTPTEIEAQLKATLPLLSTSGRLNPGQSGELLDWMHEREMIQQPMPVSDLLAGPSAGR